MKWFALVVFLFAAAAGAYVLTQGDSKSSKLTKERISRSLSQDEDPGRDEEEPPGERKRGAVEEVIQPPPAPEGAAVAQGPEGAPSSADGPPERESRKRRKKQIHDEAPPPQEHAAPDPVVQNTHRPVISPAPPPQPVEAQPPQTASAPDTSGVSGLGLGNGPLMGGVSMPVGSAAGSKPPSSSSTPSSTPSSPASSKPRSGTSAAAPSQAAPAQADKKTGPIEQEVLPIKHSPSPPPPSSPPSEDAKERSDNTDFVGLLVSPKSASVPGPNDVEKKMIAVYSLKSGFGPQDRLAVDIVRDCEALSLTVGVPACDTAAPEGGPSVAGYLLGTALLKEDLLPDSKAFDIGTTVVGSYPEHETGRELPLAEVALQIDPGRVPGHYLVRVRGHNDKSFQGSFEVTAVPAPTTAADTQSQSTAGKPASALGGKTAP